MAAILGDRGKAAKGDPSGGATPLTGGSPKGPHRGPGRIGARGRELSESPVAGSGAMAGTWPSTAAFRPAPPGQVLGHPTPPSKEADEGEQGRGETSGAAEGPHPPAVPAGWSRRTRRGTHPGIFEDAVEHGGRLTDSPLGRLLPAAAEVVRDSLGLHRKDAPSARLIANGPGARRGSPFNPRTSPLRGPSPRERGGIVYLGPLARELVASRWQTSEESRWGDRE